MSYAHVQPHSRPVSFVWCIPEVADDKYVPMPVSTIDQMSGLWSTFERTVLLDLEAASELLRNSQPSRIRVKEHVPTPTVLPKLYGVPTVGSLEAWEAYFAPEFLATKESLEGFVEPVSKRLHRRLRDMLAASSLETIRKIVAAKELARFLVMSFDHL